MATDEVGAKAAAGIVVGTSPVRLWGMTSAERLRRTLARAGIPQLSPDEAAPAPVDGSVLVLSDSWVFDESLVRALAARPNAALLADTGEAAAVHVAAPAAPAAVRWLEAGGSSAAAPEGLSLIGAEALVPAYNVALRKREPVMLVRLTPQARRRWRRGCSAAPTRA